MNRTALAHLSVFGAMVIYGANYVIMKKITPEYVLPFGLVIYRAFGAFLLFFLSGLFVKERLPKKDIALCAVLALFGVTFNQLLFIKGLSLTSPINAAIMMLTSPLLVLILSIVLGKEKATFLKYSGVIIGFGGALMVILAGTVQSSFAGNWKGDIMILFNALSWGIFLIYSRPLTVKYHVVSVMKWVFLFGAIYTLPIGLGEAMQTDFSKFTSEAWFNFLYVIIATTFFAYLLNIYALKLLTSSVVSAYIYLQPFLAAVFGLMFGMDELNAWRIMGALVVFVGVFMVSYQKK